VNYQSPILSSWRRLMSKWNQSKWGRKEPDESSPEESEPETTRTIKAVLRTTDPFIRVYRKGFFDFGVYGELVIGAKRFCTVERPWLANKPYVSCIPNGEYSLETRFYNKGGYETIEILNVPNRTNILIHKGNVPTEVQGCIAIGMEFGYVNGVWAVTNSGDAWEQFADLALKAPIPHKIWIRPKVGGV